MMWRHNKSYWLNGPDCSMWNQTNCDEALISSKKGLQTLIIVLGYLICYLRKFNFISLSVLVPAEKIRTIGRHVNVSVLEECWSPSGLITILPLACTGTGYIYLSGGKQAVNDCVNPLTACWHIHLWTFLEQDTINYCLSPRRTAAYLDFVWDICVRSVVIVANCEEKFIFILRTKEAAVNSQQWYKQGT